MEYNTFFSPSKGQRMQLGDIHVGFIGHATFLFGATDGTILLTDPYFSGGFAWHGAFETHLQRSDVRPESIEKCHAIFVSHEHGDHCDLDAIEIIGKRIGAKVLAPPDVIERVAARGVDLNQLLSLRDGQTIHLGELRLDILGGYDDAFDAQGRMNKFSLLISHKKTCLWYSGDCHTLPPLLAGRSLDAVFCWTCADVLDAITTMNPDPQRFVMMHHDRHAPGNFWCNRDPEKDALAVSAMLPGVEVIIPDRLGAFSSFDKRGSNNRIQCDAGKAAP